MPMAGATNLTTKRCGMMAIRSLLTLWKNIFSSKLKFTKYHLTILNYFTILRLNF